MPFPHPATASSWRERLGPWLDALREAIVISVSPLPTQSEICDRWITFESVDARELFASPRWTQVLEALEVLDLVVRVDAAVGWDLVFEAAHVAPSFRINEAALFSRRERRPRYCVMLQDADFREMPEQVFTALARLVHSIRVSELSPAFHAVRNELLEAWSAQHNGRAFDRENEGRIDVKLSLLLTSALNSDFARFVIHRTRQIAVVSRPDSTPPSLVRLAEEFPPSNRQPLSPTRPFHLASIDVGFLEDSITNELAYVLLDIHERGVRITELEIDRLFGAQLHAVVTTSFFPSMLGPHGCRRLRLTSGTMDDNAVEAICAGIAESTCLREFVFSNEGVRNRPPEQSQPLWWPWLAFTLFGSTTRHEIRSVTLDVRGLEVADVAMMRSVLRHPNPLACVSALEEVDLENTCLTSEPTAAHFKDGQAFEMGRLTIAERSDDARGNFSQSNIFPLVRDKPTEPYVEFVFPGVGVCWTPRENILSHSVISRRHSSPIQHLKLEHVEVVSQAAIIELLQLIGGYLTHLTLEVFGHDILNDVFLDAVCTACPRLARLDIESDITSLQWLVTPPDDGRARCRLESLSLHGRVMDFTSFQAFFQRLSNNNDGLTRTLRVFHWKKPFTLVPDVPLDQICTHWRDMLAVNQQLERSEIDLSAEGDEFMADDLVARFRPYNGAPLRTREVLAFLTVVTKPRTSTAMHQVNTETVQMILVMASLSMRRICG